VLSFHILGPLEIVTETRVLRPRGSKQNTLLMALLANPCQLVSTEALIVELWGDKHPVGVENDLHAHVSRLRRRLSAIEPGKTDSRVVTHVSGYELVIRDEELDGVGFIKGLEELRSAARADSVDLVRQLRHLLGLWRGRVFGNHGRSPILQAASARYEEHRIAAYQLLFDHELRSGNYSKIIPEVRGLLALYEFHEQFWQQLMLALYRSGRQAEALNVYREFKHRLSDQLGLDPSPTMRQYEKAVLDHHPSINHSLQVLCRSITMLGENMHPVAYEDYYASIESEAAAFAAVTRYADLATPAPTCPGWTVGHLIGHLRQGHDWFALLVASRAEEFMPPRGPAGVDLSGLDWSGQVAELARRSLDDLPGSSHGEIRARWLRQGAAGLVEAVRSAGPQARVWTTFGEPHAGFWAVLGALETAVHRADAERAVAGVARTDLPAEVAAGCVDLWLTSIASPSAKPFFGPLIGGLAGTGETLRFEATDVADGAHWFMTRAPGGPTLERRDHGADVTVRAKAADLLLLLKGRLPASDPAVTVAGEEKLLDHWLAHAYA
jgi:uncharacterized protein (TIGR03083 family)